MKTKVYYMQSSRGYWRFWSSQDECSYVYSPKVAPTLKDAMIAYARDHMRPLEHFDFQEVR